MTHNNRKLSSDPKEPWVIYHGEDGRALGGGLRSYAPSECGKSDSWGRIRHIFADAADGALCECGRFRRRVYKHCPTCQREHYSTTEPVSDHTKLLQ